MTGFVIGYFGDGPWAHRALERLLDKPEITVAFVCSRYRAPDLVLADLAYQAGIAHIVHQDVNSDSFIDVIPKVEYDLFVSMSFDQIFGSSLIEYPRLQSINCHAGKLPFYRGRNILNWVLINDEKEFGVTVHKMDEGIDTGDILAQKILPITDKDTYRTLLVRAHEACPELLVETIEALRAGIATSRRQSDIDSAGSYCKARGKGDERLRWEWTSREVFNFVRALCRPGPEARTWLGNSEIRINSVEEMSEIGDTDLPPGTVMEVEPACFTVATSDSPVRVVEWSGNGKILTGGQLS